jgi:hypothetical protein
MKYIVILLLIAFVSNAQTKEQLNLMPWPQNILQDFTITKQFKVNIR